jgi:DNA-binding NtrC family response regulator
MSGIRLLEIIKNLNEKTQVIIITSHASLETARSAISAGAYDYLVKPFDELDIITNVVKRAFDKIHLMDENQMLQDQLKDNV